jgi:hypothetical protein
LKLRIKNSSLSDSKLVVSERIQCQMAEIPKSRPLGLVTERRLIAPNHSYSVSILDANCIIEVVVAISPLPGCTGHQVHLCQRSQDVSGQQNQAYERKTHDSPILNLFSFFQKAVKRGRNGQRDFSLLSKRGRRQLNCKGQ